MVLQGLQVRQDLLEQLVRRELEAIQELVELQALLVLWEILEPLGLRELMESQVLRAQLGLLD
jgi:hypothetical protein